MLNYNIKGTDLSINDEVRAYIDKRLLHVEKFVQGDQSMRLDVELHYLQDGRSGKYRAEFTLLFDGTVYRAEHWGGALNESIDLGIGDLVAELRKAKQKRVHALRRGAQKVKDYLRGWRDTI